MPELPTIDRQYAVENIDGLYRTERNELYQDAVRVIRRWTGQGKTYLTIELLNGQRWKLARRFARPEGPPIYSVSKVRNDEFKVKD